MLKFKPTNTFKARVSFLLLGDNPDVQESASIVCSFKHFDRDKFAQLMDEKLSDHEFIRRVVTGFEEVVDAEGKPLEFDTALNLVIGDLGISGAVIYKFIEAHKRAGEKNGQTSRGR